MPQSIIPKGMVRFTHALVEDASLRSWFLGLEGLSTSLRQAAFSQMAQQMRSDGEDLGLAAAVSALARPEIYEAVLRLCDSVASCGDFRHCPTPPGSRLTFPLTYASAPH
jgi:hypothetical protein